MQPYDPSPLPGPAATVMVMVCLFLLKCIGVESHTDAMMSQTGTSQGHWHRDWQAAVPRNHSWLDALVPEVAI